MLILVNSLLSQKSLQRPLAISLNSTSTLDQDTTFCLLLHVTKLPPANIKYLDMGFLSSILLVSSASVCTLQYYDDYS